MNGPPSTPERCSSKDGSNIPSPTQQGSNSPKYKPRQSIRLNPEDVQSINRRRSLTPNNENRSSTHMTFFYKENLKELDRLQEELSRKKTKLNTAQDEMNSLKSKLETVEFKMNNLKEEKQVKVRQIGLKRNELNSLDQDHELKLEFMRNGFDLEIKKIEGKYHSEMNETESKFKFEVQQVEFERIQKFKQEKEHLLKDIQNLNDEVNNNDNVINQLKEELDKKYSNLKEKWMVEFQTEWKNITEANQSMIKDINKLSQDIENNMTSELDQSKDKRNILEKELAILEEKLNEKNAFKESITVQIDTVEEEIEQTINQRKELNEYITNSKNELLQINEILIKEETMRRKLHNEIQELRGNIRVYCRIRPPLENEVQDISHIHVSNFDNRNGSQAIQISKEDRNSKFLFDKVFSTNASNRDVFEEVGQLIQSSLDGYNVCIFAYGQTGSGKTYTMMNDPDGVIPMTLDHIFDWTRLLKERGWDYSFEAQFIEIYNEQIVDLLRSLNPEPGPTKYEIRHDGDSQRTSITNVTSVKLETRTRVNTVLRTANKTKSIAATNSNERSSRSHSVFTIRIHGTNSITGEASDGVLNLVDLAGSERIDTSNVTGDRLRETQNINKSLSCLGDVIYALNGKDMKHIPFRNSKLTYLLQYSLIGDSKTLMFVNVSPSSNHVKETLNSLRFASKVNSTKINQH
ncbi:Kar3 [Kluyveromyces lactis]|nr:Kar3 [Kluyveromyces lactis]